MQQKAVAYKKQGSAADSYIPVGGYECGGWPLLLFNLAVYSGRDCFFLQRLKNAIPQTLA